MAEQMRTWLLAALLGPTWMIEPAIAQTLDTGLIERTVIERRIPVIVRVKAPPAGAASVANAAAKRFALSGLSDSAAINAIPRLGVVTAMVDEADLRRLSADPGVLEIVEDRAFEISASTKALDIIGWSDLRTAHPSANASGARIAVLDTGVDAGHPVLQGKVVEEACFGRSDAFGNTSYCPNGGDVHISSGSTGVATPCSDDGCWHGTHVAALIAGSGGIQGTAAGASIVAVQVFNKVTSGVGCSSGTPCVKAYASTIGRALAHIIDRVKTGDQIRAVNLSIATEHAHWPTHCDRSASLREVVSGINQLQ